MRKAILAGTIALIGGVVAGCGQPGGYGYGPSYGGYGPSYGYGGAPGFYGQPAAPNPLAQVLGAMMTPSPGFGQGYYQPAPAYGPRYF